jgi:hypothetical protein
MPSAWVGKLCQRCGGHKGDKYRADKYCGNCRHAIRRQHSANAHARALEQRYGITRDDYWELYHSQGGHCYICQRATGTGRKRLTVDHDHKTGLVRGLLCSTCNTILGHFRDDPAVAQRVIDYLGEPPFARMMLSRRSATIGASNGHDGRAGDIAAG